MTNKLSTNLSKNLVDEFGDEHVDGGAMNRLKLQEEEQPEQDLHAAEIMLRRVHATLVHPSNRFDVASPS